MAKILYPVGTLVTVRKDEDKTVYQVTDYKKGEKYPYRLGYLYEPSSGPVEVAGMTKFSIKGLRRYKDKAETDSDYEVAQEYLPDATVENVATTQDQSISRHEVETFMRDMYLIVEDALLNSQEALDEATRAHAVVHKLTEVTNQNIRAIAKQFNSMQHNDD